MKCITSYCQNGTFGVWYAPANYSLATYQGEPMHHCSECGAKWREVEEKINAISVSGSRGRLHEFLLATKEFHAGQGGDGTFRVGGHASGRREP